MALIEELTLPYWETFVRVHIGRVSFDQGDEEDGLKLMREQLRISHELNRLMFWPHHATLLADALCRVGNMDEARHYLDEAMAIVEHGGERWAEPDIWRVRGDLRAAAGKQGEADAEASYRKAIEIAHSQSAKSWELRAATRLARLWHSQRKTSEAQDLRSPRPPRPDLRLVHRGVRHRRPERGEGAARRAVLIVGVAALRPILGLYHGRPRSFRTLRSMSAQAYKQKFTARKQILAPGPKRL